MEEHAILKRIIMISFNLIAFTTFLFLANILKSVLIGSFIFLLFGFINMIIPDDKRIHAKNLIYCFILSNLYLFFCLIIYKFSLNYMDQRESIYLIILLILCANLFTSNILWWKRNELNARVYDWVIFNLDNKELLKYKEQLKENDKKKYYIYIYYFEEQKSINSISKIMNIDIQRIGEEIGTMSHHIEYGIRLR